MEHPVANPDLEDQQAREMADALADLVPRKESSALPWPPPPLGDPALTEREWMERFFAWLDAAAASHLATNGLRHKTALTKWYWQLEHDLL